jgi:LysM repeat protein
MSLSGVTKMSELFDRLVKTYIVTAIEFSYLKEISLAQWLLESGRGTSDLATKHLNFGGLKWRKEMEGFATSVDYEAHDGLDKYCKFESLEAFIKGYWRFLDRDPYKGWRDRAGSGEEFINFIGPIYATDRNYAGKVLNLYAEAKTLFSSVDNGDHRHTGTAEPFKKPAIKDFIQSPNFSSRDGGKINSIILHYTTAGTVQSTINHFKNRASEVSAHYIIDKNGDIYQMVQDGDKAWHAGNANRHSIGIEHVARVGDELTEAQEKSSIALIRWLMSEYKISKDNIKGHKQVGSTSCPGNIFGDNIDDGNLPKLKSWIDKNFSIVVPNDATRLVPSGIGIYVVRRGDTLSAIADRHDMTLAELLALNPDIADPDQIFVGQQIKVERDGNFITGKSRKLNLPITIAEFQLNANNYQRFAHSLLGNITITGGFMEPNGHSQKPEMKAIFLSGELKTLAPANRNIGIDYYVENGEVKAWYGGIITKAGREGGYGRRVHIQLDVTYRYQGKDYQVYQAYAHNQEIEVSVGQEITQGQQIAIMGGSGIGENDYPPHVDLSTYLFIGGVLVQLNPQALDRQMA